MLSPTQNIADVVEKTKTAIFQINGSHGPESALAFNEEIIFHDSPWTPRRQSNSSSRWRTNHCRINWYRSSIGHGYF